MSVRGLLAGGPRMRKTRPMSVIHPEFAFEVKLLSASSTFFQNIASYSFSGVPGVGSRFSQNEYEAIFWKKVKEADKSFTSKANSGCITDMGRVFLMLGPPANKPITDIRGRTIWHYEPNEVTGIKEKFDLTFAQDMTSSLLLDRKRLEDYVKAHPETLGIGWKISRDEVMPWANVRSNF